MGAPGRFLEVNRIVDEHRDLFGSDDRRRGLLYYICEGLNMLDGGEWGVLVKDDRGGFIPSDVIVYRSTMEHFDVLAGDPDRASWQPDGIIANPSWRWERASTMLFAPGTGPQAPAPPAPGEPPAPLPAPAPAPCDDVAAFLAELVEPLDRTAGGVLDLAAEIKQLNTQLADLRANGVRVRLR